MTTYTSLLLPSNLIPVTGEVVPELVQTDRAALILINGGCKYSRTLCLEIEGLVRDGKLDGIDIGTLDLGERHAAEYENANPWVRDLESIPYIVLYRDGRLVERFPAFRATAVYDRMLEIGFLATADVAVGMNYTGDYQQVA